MRKLSLTLAALSLTALASPGIAQAATGGKITEPNPGIVALTDALGNQLCSAVLVDPHWALTYHGAMTCAAATHATSDSHNPVRIDHQVERSTDPGESQAMLVHFDSPITNVKPAILSTKTPKAGETLSIAAYNGPEGFNHLLAVGQSAITTSGHNAWISWYPSPENMTLETGKDSGAPIFRGDEVIAFTGLVTDRSADAEDVANVADWVHDTVH